MVSPPRRATHAAAAEAGPACARPTPAHEAPAAQPAYWLAQRAAPADLASRPRTAPRASPAFGQRLLDARCMLLLLPPPRDSSASGEGLRGPFKYVSGPSPSNEIKPSGYHEGCALLAARCMRTPLPRVPPPDRIYVYSPEIALRLAYIRKIHLYFSTHRSLSARCDLSRVRHAPLPMRVRPRVSLPTLPVDHMNVSLYDHMYSCMPLRPRMSTYII